MHDHQSPSATQEFHSTSLVPRTQPQAPNAQQWKHMAHIQTPKYTSMPTTTNPNLHPLACQLSLPPIRKQASHLACQIEGEMAKEYNIHGTNINECGVINRWKQKTQNRSVNSLQNEARQKLHQTSKLTWQKLLKCNGTLPLTGS